MPRSGPIAAARLPSLVVAVCLTACGANGSPTPSTGDVASPSPSTSVGQGGSTAAETPAVQVPEQFPVMPGAASVAPSPAGYLVARWLTDANGADVYDYYVEALPVAGFQIEQVLPGGEAAVIRFATSDGQVLDLSLTSEGDGTRIDLRVPDEGG